LTELIARVQAALGDAFRVESELGGGGMSRLFLATEASLNRRVVIKLLPPDLASEVSAARFKQEMEFAARLQHPHILPILAAGAREGLLYYIMPYVAGESLRGRLEREGRLSVADASRLLAEVADALAFAHGLGIIHRDIKPENVLLEGKHAVLADFGIARALLESRTQRALTATGTSIGTPGYMAPEQLSGESVDARFRERGILDLGRRGVPDGITEQREHPCVRGDRHREIAGSSLASTRSMSFSRRTNVSSYSSSGPPTGSGIETSRASVGCPPAYDVSNAARSPTPSSTRLMRWLGDIARIRSARSASRSVSGVAECRARSRP